MPTTKPGVYRIVNTVSGNFYVGSASSISARWSTHKYDLRRGRHSNGHLQNAWNKYGEDAFRLEVMEVAEEWDRNIQALLETRWIQQLKPQYNIAPVAMSRLGVKRGSHTWRTFLCEDFFHTIGWVFHTELSWYVWDAPDDVLALFGVPDGESYRRSRPQPDYVLASRTPPGKAPRYLLARKVTRADVLRLVPDLEPVQALHVESCLARIDRSPAWDVPGEGDPARSID